MGHLDRIGSHEASLSPHLFETLPVLLKGGKVFFFPTNAGWTSTLVGSGAASQAPDSLYASTGTTASSSALLYSYVKGLGLGGSGSYINWGKKLYIYFVLQRGNSDAEAVGRFQFKSAITIGALAAKGIGLRVDNLALTGESYGTALGTVDLGVTLTAGYECGMLIVLDPATPKIEWYVDVNGAGFVLKGTQSTAAKIPTGQTDLSSIVASIANGATGGVNANQYLGQIFLWQKRD